MKAAKILILALVVHCSCKDEKTIKPFLDPFEDSFRGKNINLITVSDTLSKWSVDTILLDAIGNVKRVRRFWYEDVREYDSLNFIRRKIMKSDIHQCFIMSYKFVDDSVLIQDWYELPYYGLKRSDSIESRFFKRVKFSFDQEGFPMKQIDSLENSITRFNYLADHLLTSKVITSLDSSLFIARHSYFYDQDVLIRTEYLVRANSEITGEKLARVFEFKNGLPSVLIEYWDSPKKSKFSYVYR